jgi:glyoxylase-like metal-dependent hydrolase (beta-lactamase superfamily II)
MERVADGVYQVKRGFRAFVIDGDEGVTLVDTGLPRATGVVLKGLESIGRTVTDIVSIVLTHSHADHAGGAAELKKSSGAELYCAAADEAAVAGRQPVPDPPFVQGPFRLLAPVLRLLPAASPVEVDHDVGEGFRLKLPEDLTATATPGHTPGHTSYLLDRAGGILFAGDAASHRRGRVSRGWFNTARPDIDTGVRRLAELEFSIACFGHADPLTSDAAGAFRRFAATL